MRRWISEAIIPLAVALGCLICGPVKAQPAEKMVRLGYLAPAKIPNLLAAFKRGLRDRGYVEGRNLSIEFRFADGRPERLDAFAAELMQLAPDVIVTVGTTATLAAKRATSTLPIVAAPAGDPILRGVVHSLAQPGGNVTGVTLYASELSQKRLEVLREAVPAIKRIAVLGNANNINHPALWEDAEAAGRKLGLELRPVMVKGLSDLGPAFAVMTRDAIDALAPLSDAEFDSGRDQIVRLVTEHRLPAIYDNRAFVETGGLMSYGPNIDRMGYRAAVYVDKILQGAKPADLPMEQPTTFELVINLQTAKALGIALPPSLLARADEVIE